MSCEACYHRKNREGDDFCYMFAKYPGVHCQKFTEAPEQQQAAPSNSSALLVCMRKFYPAIAGHAIMLQDCASRAPLPDRLALMEKAEQWAKMAAEIHAAMER